MRIISLSTYNAHTEPLLKNLEILTIKNLFDLNCLKFVYNYKKENFPITSEILDGCREPPFVITKQELPVS